MSDWKAKDLIKLLRDKYPPAKEGAYQPYVVLEQVPDGTGMHQSHWIDAVVFSLWEMHGLWRAAYDVKVSRSDFLHELQIPEKHKWCMECFHNFWFIAPDDVIQLEELPVGVGWMCPRGDKLVIKRHAVANPNPRLDSVLLAAFMRGASKEIDRANHVGTDEVLSNSYKYKEAKTYQDATVKFLEHRGNLKYLTPECTPDDVFRWLEEATADRQVTQDKEHLLEIAGRFQNEVAGLLNLFLMIANKGILARDSLGKYLVNYYGGVNDESTMELKRYTHNSEFVKSQKQYAEFVEAILKLGSNGESNEH